MSQRSQRSALKAIAEATMCVIDAGSVTVAGTTHDLAARITAMEAGTEYIPPASYLSRWKDVPSRLTTSLAASGPSARRQRMEVLEMSTVAAARALAAARADSVGVLNFASAKKPGGGFLSGAQAQEESLARTSTLYASLVCPAGEKFYKLHKANPQGCFYSHAMIWSPGAVFFRDDAGALTPPFACDVVTSPAVNAGAVRKNHPDTADHILATMRERMARILFLFESKSARRLVLGSFGTGVFRNDVGSVARIWAALLGPGGRFAASFDHVVFAILGRDTFDTFKEQFEKDVAAMTSQGDG